MVFADSTLFKVFTLPMIYGDPVKALTQPHSVVITEDMAVKYFKTVNALNKILMVNDTVLYKVTGVIKDIPVQAHFNYDFFLSMASLPEGKDVSWVSNNFATYLLLKKGASAKAVEAMCPKMAREHEVHHHVAALDSEECI